MATLATEIAEEVTAPDDSRASVDIDSRAPRRQRRAAYRVCGFASDQPVVELRHPAVREIGLALPVIDLSADGCALLLPPDMPPIEPGVTINGARIRIGSAAPLGVSLHVRHVTLIQPGADGARLGCRFVGLAAAVACALQRHVDRVQRRGRAFGGHRRG